MRRRHLFDANIFFPARHTLAFSEPLIVPALLGAPVAWAGGSPVLVMNLMVIAGFALTAFAGFALVYRWTGDVAAGLLAGATFAFNTHTLTRLPHVQALHLYGLPLALLATDRLIIKPRARDALWLALWMAVLAYTSGYLVVFAAIMVVTALLVRVREWLPHSRSVLPMFALAAALAAVVIAPLWVPYHQAAVEHGMMRSLDNVAEYSATMKGYLAAAGTIHASTWSRSFFLDPVDSFFPGFVVIALTLVALWRAWSSAATHNAESAVLTRRRVMMLVAIAIVGLILSLGTRTPVYGWLYAVFPPMHGLRAAARFGNLFLLGMSVLAGVGLAAARARYPGRRSLAAAILLVVVANVEALRAPFEFRRFDGVPGIYKLLAERASRRPGGGAVLSASGGLRKWRVRVELDRTLAAADERVQRIHAGHVLRLCRRVLVFPAGARDPGDAAGGRHARDGASGSVRARGRRGHRGDRRATRVRADGGRIAGHPAVPAALRHTCARLPSSDRMSRSPRPFR